MGGATTAGRLGFCCESDCGSCFDGAPFLRLGRLIGNPHIILFDELTAGLDPPMACAILELAISAIPPPQLSHCFLLVEDSGFIP